MPDARVRLPRARLALLAVSALAIAGCGSSSSHPSAGSATTATHASSSAGATPAATVAAIAAAENPGVAQFPAANGRTLRQLGKLVRSAPRPGRSPRVRAALPSR